MARRTAPLAALLALVALAGLTACGDSDSTNPGTTSTAAQRSPATPQDLVGAWTVDAAGEEPGLVMTLAPSQLYLWRACGWAGGHWQGNSDGLFTAEATSTSSKCPSPSTPSWLGDATSAVVQGPERVLLNRTGAVVARLTESGRPTPGDDISSSEANLPTVTDEIRAQSRPAAPLPAGIAPATEATLLGKWEQATGVVRDEDGKAAAIEFRVDGEYGGNDGCNGFAGRWGVGEAGSFLITAGARTMIACPGQQSDASGELFETARLGFDGQVVVLYAQDGKELNRLRRVGT